MTIIKTAQNCILGDYLHFQALSHVIDEGSLRYLLVSWISVDTHTHTHGQTDRYAHTNTDGQADRHAHTRTDKQTDMHTHTHGRTNRQTCTHTHGRTNRQTCTHTHKDIPSSSSAAHSPTPVRSVGWYS